MMKFNKKNTGIGELVGVRDQSVLNKYMMQFYKKKKSIFWGASVCWGPNCIRLLHDAVLQKKQFNILGGQTS